MDHSSESEDERNIRHDRFRSERFQDSSSAGSRIREGRRIDKHSSRRQRERSPYRTHKYGDKSVESSSNIKSRSKYDRKCDRDHHSKSRKSDKKESCIIEKKQSKINECDKEDLPAKSKNKLSSLLKNFDKQVELKNKQSESPLEIGPALPPKSIERVQDEQESDKNIVVTEEIQRGPSLSPNLKDFNKPSSSSTDEGLKSSNSAEPPLPCKELLSESKNTISQIFEEDSSIHETKNTFETNIENKNNTEVSEPSSYGPALPPVLKSESSKESSIGPALPLYFKKPIANQVLISSSLQDSQISMTDDTESCANQDLSLPAETDSYGPALPPNYKKNAILGPTLPSGMTPAQLEEIAQHESDDEDMVGPLPEGKMNMTQYQLDLRAMSLKRKLEEEKNGPKTDTNKREEWMLELPPEKASNLGLGPRSFRMREAPDMSNRSSWTDTPADKLRKEEMALRGESEPVNSEETMRTAFIIERDKAMDKLSKTSQEQDRPKSLLELHQKKLKKKKKKEEEEGKKKERRPFDRNIDLQVNRFDDAQKKAIFKKARLLDTRFSSGESKYL